MSDAESAVDFAILDAIAHVGNIIRVPAGSEQTLINTIKASLFNQGLIWAAQEYILELQDGWKRTSTPYSAALEN